MKFPRMSTSRPQRGFTLVEIVVAAMVLGLSVIALVTMLRKGGELSVNDDHRRQARALVQAVFERPTYSYSNYTALSTTMAGTTATENVTLDRQKQQTLPGVLRIAVGSLQSHASPSGAAVPYVRVTATLSWSEDGVPDSITVFKLISDPR